MRPLGLHLLLCWDNHIRGSLVSTDEKVTVTIGKGLVSLMNLLRAPKALNHTNLVYLFSVWLLTMHYKVEWKFSKNPRLLIHWLNPRSERAADVAALCDSLLLICELSEFSQMHKNLQTVWKTLICRPFFVFLLLASTALGKLFILTGRRVFVLLSLLLFLFNCGHCVLVSRCIMNLLCYSCHS